eukprot:5479625-Amphidinium_carterae.1
MTKTVGSRSIFDKFVPEDLRWIDQAAKVGAGVCEGRVHPQFSHTAARGHECQQGRTQNPCSDVCEAIWKTEVKHLQDFTHNDLQA